MSKSNRSIPPACKYAEAASAEPQLQYSCAAQERTRKKTVNCLLGNPCASLMDPPGILHHKSRLEIRFLRRQDPTCANKFEIWKSRFQHAQFTLRQWQMLPSLHQIQETEPEPIEVVSRSLLKDLAVCFEVFEMDAWHAKHRRATEAVETLCSEQESRDATYRIANSR